ncbi:hypothetical protein D3C80_2205950 [compost metagenome]
MVGQRQASEYAQWHNPQGVTRNGSLIEQLGQVGQRPHVKSAGLSRHIQHVAVHQSGPERR